MKLGNRIDRDFHFDFENLIDHILGGATKEAESFFGSWCPRVSLFEREKDYSLVMELAGVSPEDVSIEMQDGKLEVAGHKKLEPETEGVTIHKSERSSGKFRRTFDFAAQVDADRIVAEFKNGLLTITLPKSETILPRKIQINATGS